MLVLRHAEEGPNEPFPFRIPRKAEREREEGPHRTELVALALKPFPKGIAQRPRAKSKEVMGIGQEVCGEDNPSASPSEAGALF